MSYVKTIISYLIVALLAAVAGYLYGVRPDGTTAATVREQYRSVGEQQQQITGGLKEAEGTVEELGRIIKDCKRILQQVRNQPRSEVKAN